MHDNHLMVVYEYSYVEYHMKTTLKIINTNPVHAGTLFHFKSITIREKNKTNENTNNY